MEFSEKAKAVINSWVTNNNNIVINAVPGSGKTTLLLELARVTENGSILITAFNNHIQKEISEKINNKNISDTTTLTFHSIGFSAIKNAYTKVTLDKNKMWKIVDILSKDSRLRGFTYKQKTAIKAFFVECLQIARLHFTVKYDEILKIMIGLNKPVFLKIDGNLFWDSLIENLKNSYEGDNIVIDFTDMLFLPIYKNLDMSVNPDYIFVDEAQDLSLCQHYMVRKIMQQSAKRFVAVGDDNQFIYAFAGACEDSLNKFFDYKNTLSFPLDICYRCPKKVVDLANTVFNTMIAFQDSDGIVENDAKIIDIKENSVVVCRNTRPLIVLFFELFKIGVRCSIKGSDVLEPVKNILKEFKDEKLLTVVKAVEDKLSKLSEVKNDVSYEIYTLTESLKTLIILMKNFQDIKNVNEMLSIIDNFFDTESTIELMTIHKAKGLEANTVYILNSDLIPSSFSKTPSQLKQEYNLLYIAFSRAKESFYFLNIDLD